MFLGFFAEACRSYFSEKVVRKLSALGRLITGVKVTVQGIQRELLDPKIALGFSSLILTLSDQINPGPDSFDRKIHSHAVLVIKDLNQAE